MCPFRINEMKDVVFELYESLCAWMKDAKVVFGEDLPDGCKATTDSGEDIVPSPFEMESVATCVAQVFIFADQSKKLPDVDALDLWFESLEAGPEGSTSILLSVVLMVALRLSIARGDGDSVLHMLRNIREEVERRPTVVSTLLKTPTEQETGSSSDDRSPGKESGGQSATSAIEVSQTEIRNVRAAKRLASNSTYAKKLKKKTQKKTKK